MQVDSVARVSKVALSLLFSSVVFATISAASHTHLQSLSYATLFLTALTGLLALVKIVNSISTKFPKPIANCIHWIHAMVFEVLALLVLPILQLMKTSSPSGPKEGRPILLVHGYCNDGSVWAYQRKMLAKDHLGPIYSIDLGHPFKSIREYAIKVGAKADQIQKETGRSDLILVGHSMGGLVSSLYALQFAPHGTVTDVVTIGSPLAGTHMARIGVGPNAKEMQRKSELVYELNERLNKENLIRFYHIGTKTDQLIVPSHSALRGYSPDREFLFQDMGHVSLLFSPRVTTLLAEWIKAGSVATDLRISG